MKRYKVVMTQPAAADLQSIANYIAYELKEPAAAKKLLGKIKETVTGLTKMPTRHALVADERLAFNGIRKTLVDNYIVFYVVPENDATVIIIRILYSRRDWEHLL